MQARKEAGGTGGCLETVRLEESGEGGEWRGQEVGNGGEEGRERMEEEEGRGGRKEEEGPNHTGNQGKIGGRRHSAPNYSISSPP